MIKPGDVIVVTNPHTSNGIWASFKGTLAVAKEAEVHKKFTNQWFKILINKPELWNMSEFCLSLPIDMTEIEIIGRIDV